MVTYGTEFQIGNKSAEPGNFQPENRSIARAPTPGFRPAPPKVSEPPGPFVCLFPLCPRPQPAPKAFFH